MTSSQAGSPANQSASQEPDKLKMIRDGYGPSSSESFAWYDPDMSSWKTSQVSLLPEWATYSETWPRAGTTVSGKAFRLPLLAPRTYGGGSSLLPTPRSANASIWAVRMEWATPQASDTNYRDKSTYGRVLSREVGGQLNPTWVEWLMGFPEGWTDLED